jgi:hypothetical protein
MEARQNYPNPELSPAAIGILVECQNMASAILSPALHTIGINYLKSGIKQNYFEGLSISSSGEYISADIAGEVSNALDSEKYQLHKQLIHELGIKEGNAVDEASVIAFERDIIDAEAEQMLSFFLAHQDDTSAIEKKALSTVNGTMRVRMRGLSSWAKNRTNGNI